MKRGDGATLGCFYPRLFSGHPEVCSWPSPRQADGSSTGVWSGHPFYRCPARFSWPAHPAHLPAWTVSLHVEPRWPALCSEGRGFRVLISEMAPAPISPLSSSEYWVSSSNMESRWHEPPRQPQTSQDVTPACTSTLGCSSQTGHYFCVLAPFVSSLYDMLIHKCLWGQESCHTHLPNTCSTEHCDEHSVDI